MFDFDGTMWNETKLTASDTDSDDQFGFAVTLSSDRVLIGAPQDDCDAGGDCGSAYVFDLASSGPAVDLAVTSFTDPIARGGPFEVFATVENTTAEEVRVRVRLEVEGPGGLMRTIRGRAGRAPAGALVGPVRAVGPVAVPTNAPSGTYTGTLILTVKTTGEELDRESFTFDLPESRAVIASGAGVEAWAEIPESASVVASPEALSLSAPSPNPARGSITLEYAVAVPGEVSVVVVDALGREVAVAARGQHAAGRYEARVGLGPLAPGVYVVRLSSGVEARMRRFTVVR